MEQQLERLELLLGPAAIHKLATCKIALVGLGGVGGPALECLVRSGVKRFLLVDADIVQPSNLNRQMLYTKTDVGTLKVVAAKNRIETLATQLEIVTSDVFIDEDKIAVINEYQPDYLIDAIDSIIGKTALISWAINYQVPFITSLGIGNRLNPTALELTTLDQTKADPLAKALRSALRKKKINIAQVPVVFSKEEPIRKDKPVGSYMAVTASAGLLLAHHIIATILER